jgi:MYXO-CTERM domain-containing protein
MRQSLLNVGAIAVFAATASVANATMLAQWTFNTPINPVTHANYWTAPDAGPYDGTFYIQTGDGNTTFSTPAGNGSAYGLSADRWSTGSFAQVYVYDLPLGQQSFQLSWDQTRASGGPSEFRVDVSFGGQNFTTLPNSAYSVIQAGALFSGTNPWSASGPRQTPFTNTITFNGTFTDFGDLYIRLVATGANLGNGAARFDNIVLSSSTIPAPGAIALLGLAGFARRSRR